MVKETTCNEVSNILRVMLSDFTFLGKGVDGDSPVPDSWDVKIVKSEKYNFGWYQSNKGELLRLSVRDARVAKCVESVKKEELKRTQQKNKFMR